MVEISYNYEYPYVDPYRYNDDWLLAFVKKWKEVWEREWPKLLAHEAEQDELIQQIVDDLSDLKAGDYEWLKCIISHAIKNVWFGLTESGYFVAYIPESWTDIRFNTTGYDINVPLQQEYGHLVLSDALTGEG